MKTVRERIEKLIEEIEAREVQTVKQSDLFGILLNAKATALAALVQLEHASAGIVINNTFDQMKEMSEERIKTFEEMWKDIETKWNKMHSHLFYKGENGGNGI